MTEKRQEKSEIPTAHKLPKPCRRQTMGLHLAALLLPVLILSSAMGCARSEVPTSAGGFALDTYVSITAYGTDEATLQEVLTLCSDYEKLFSKTIQGSDVWRINHSDGETVLVSKDTIALLEAAGAYDALSHGLVDPAIGAVTALWDFHGGYSENDVPSPIPSASALSEALAHISYDSVRIDGDTVTLSDPDTRLDLGFIAKGFIADRLRDALLERGITSAIINLGGNVLLVGNKPGSDGGHAFPGSSIDATPYTVGIEKPFGNGQPLLTIKVSDCAVVTSGIYERYFVQDDVLYHHILDPRTGYPIDNGLYSVTILAPDATTADALSTTCFALGLEDGLALVASMEDVEALFIDDQMKIYTSDEFPAYQLYH